MTAGGETPVPRGPRGPGRTYTIAVVANLVLGHLCVYPWAVAWYFARNVVLARLGVLAAYPGLEEDEVPALVILMLGTAAVLVLLFAGLNWVIRRATGDRPPRYWLVAVVALLLPPMVAFAWPGSGVGVRWF